MAERVEGSARSHTSVLQSPNLGLCLDCAARIGAPSADMASGTSARSRTKKPSVSSEGASGCTPSRGNTPKAGFHPITPQNDAGRITEPAVCVPSASGTMPSATAAAEPLDEPPGVRDGAAGLRVLPGQYTANSVVTVLPSTIAPARRSARTQAASAAGRWPRWMGDP